MKLILLSLLTTLALTANDKVAMVIGNKNYTNQTGLQNPISDARLIRDTLKGMDFEVMEVYNKNLNALSDQLDEFITKARGAKVAVIYYAGHGIGVGRNNYLIPLGASNLSVDNLGRKLMSLNELKGAVAKANGFGVVFFDACRNSFFSGQIQGLGSGRGSRALVQPTVRRGQNILVSFSTQAGKIAKDDVNSGNHSPYALALSENLNSSKDIRLVMGSVRAKVKKLTSFEQIPVDENQLDGEEYCLSEREKPIPSHKPIPKPQPEPISTSKWITPEDSVCKENGGGIYEGICSTSWEKAKNICSASGAKLPTESDLKKIVLDCGGTWNNWKKNRSNRHYRACYKKKGFHDNDFYWTAKSKKNSGIFILHFFNGYNYWHDGSPFYEVICVNKK